MDVEADVLVFGIGEAADDEYRNRRFELANLADELGSVHAGHDVVGDDEVDGSGELVVAELLKSPFGVERCDDEVSGSLENGLACGSLNGIVVYEENCCRHAFLNKFVFRLSCADRNVVSFANSTVLGFDAESRIKAACIENE